MAVRFQVGDEYLAVRLNRKFPVKQQIFLFVRKLAYAVAGVMFSIVRSFQTVNVEAVSRILGKDCVGMAWIGRIC